MLDPLVDFLAPYTAWMATPMLRKLLSSFLIVFCLMVGRALVLRVARRRITSPDTYYFWRQVSGHVMVAMAVVLVAYRWFDGFTPAFTVLTLVAAALTIIHKEPITNLTAWPFITWRSLFSIGDRIQVGTHLGDVLELGLFYFTLSEIGQVGHADQPTGRVIKVPNSLILTTPVINYGTGRKRVWHEVIVPLTKESDWQLAETVLLEVVRALEEPDPPSQAKAPFLPPPPPPGVYLRVQAQRLECVVRYRCAPQERLSSEAALWRAVLTRFGEFSGVSVAFA